MNTFGAPASSTTVRRSAVQRLLFVADAAVADVDELPPAGARGHRFGDRGLRRHAHPAGPARVAGRRRRSIPACRRRAPRHRARSHALDRRRRERSCRPWQRPDRHRGRRRGLHARPHPGRAAQLRARQLAGATSDRAHRGPLRPAGHRPTRSTSEGARRAPTGHCFSVTTDQRTPRTPSSARAHCSLAGARSW